MVATLLSTPLCPSFLMLLTLGSPVVVANRTSSILGPGLVTYWLWWVRIKSAAMSLISPFNKFSLDKTHGLMKCFYFCSPQVPDYLEYIKQPMDLSTIQDKVSSLQYDNLEDFHNDIHLMISNCMIYNSKDTPFYKAALRMTDQVNCCSKSYEHETLTTALHFLFLFFISRFLRNLRPFHFGCYRLDTL